MKKIAIIGGGVAGITAAIYALRANAEVTMFEQFGLGGLVATIDKIENYPSYKSVEGWQLASDMAASAVNSASSVSFIFEQSISASARSISKAFLPSLFLPRASL